jgi:hypothetical protein
MRQAVATNLAVFKLQVSFHDTEGEGLEAIHKATALGPASHKLLLISQRQHPELLISTTSVIIDGDTLHKAEFARAHVHKGGTCMLPLGWVLVVHRVLGALQIRGSRVASHGAAVEVPKGLWVFGETDKALEGGVIVSTAGEGEHPMTV